MRSNPFGPLNEKEKPIATETNYHTDEDNYIITYGVVEKVKMIGKKDTDFVVLKDVEEIDRINRQEYYDSNANEVGILNIIEKVRLSGDQTLLNQTGRVGVLSGEFDEYGHPLEKIVDVSRYQVDQVDALESYKKGAASFESLDPELKKKKSLEAVAKMSDEEIDAFLKSRIKVGNSSNEEKGEN